jgi:hypothetical protein
MEKKLLLALVYRCRGRQCAIKRKQKYFEGVGGGEGEGGKDKSREGETDRETDSAKFQEATKKENDGRGVSRL